MKRPESYVTVFVLISTMLVFPMFTQAIAQLWWGFGSIPLLPIILLVSFFLLPAGHYMIIALMGGWWYDVSTDALGPIGLVAVVVSSVLLYATAHLIASRSLLSDLFTVSLLYVVWLCTLFFVNIIVLRIAPLTPAVEISTMSVLIGLGGVWFIYLIIRRTILQNAIVPKALL